MMTESQASKILLDISFGNVWFYRENHAEAADTLVNAYRKLKSRVAVAENTNDEHVQTITKLQSQLAKENTRNQELEQIIHKQKKVTADAVNNETRVRELEALFKTLENANESLKADADQYQKELYDLQEVYTQETEELNGEKDTLEHDLDNLTKAKKELEADLNKYELKFDELEKELAEKTAQVEELQSIRDDLNWFKAEIRKFYDEVMKDGQ
jgi:DNA repair exonuclease SbcCD ATPase subunit